MSASKRLVLDANVLISAALGRRVYPLLRSYRKSIEFCAPDVSFESARDYVPKVLRHRGRDLGPGLRTLDKSALLVRRVELSVYRWFEPLARELMAPRDLDDWPIAAAALMLKAPIWTEDQDFFGCGIATWTSDRIAIYLEGRFDTN